MQSSDGKTESKTPKVTLQLTNQKTPLYRVVYSTELGTDSKAVIKQFVTDIREGTGATLEIVTDKSDILQVAHHGVNASVGTQHLKEFYTAVNPSVALCSNLEKTVAEAAFVPNFALSDAEWIYSDEERTTTIFN